MKAAQRAYTTLRAGIIEGAHPPGARITEQEIAESAGVSRTPVREALRRLEAEGIVRFVPHQGAFVTTWSVQDAEDIFELRAMLEGYGARLAAGKATDADVAQLRQLAVSQCEEASARSPGYLERIADLNSQFHHRLLQVASSARLEATLVTISSAPLVLQTFRDYDDDDLGRSAHHHLEIVEAIEAGDAAWAESVMRSHVMAARRAFRSKHRPNPGP
ncbi:MAG TPA: GntR family transcriptional regulator [Woeseiaceae bacterium]|nr:GntR family transcriptional regulator [Woeseiaceae bacterium]